MLKKQCTILGVPHGVNKPGSGAQTPTSGLVVRRSDMLGCPDPISQPIMLQRREMATVLAARAWGTT